MSFLHEIFQAYRCTDFWVGSQKDPSPDTISWSRISELNRCAYFVLLFGQLEDYINVSYGERVGPPEEAAFMHRVHCVFEDDATAELIGDYYNIRCDIAHGHAESGQMGKEIELPRVYEEILDLIVQG
ncbi:MAG: hypothetical protein NTW86_16305 [Candidatus Sumerlaeota bacterium]|nr:hypothetical protein [Candidatus Sumerlaeota bacterium]